MDVNEFMTGVTVLSVGSPEEKAELGKPLLGPSVTFICCFYVSFSFSFYLFIFIYFFLCPLCLFKNYMKKVKPENTSKQCNKSDLNPRHA